VTLKPGLGQLRGHSRSSLCAVLVGRRPRRSPVDIVRQCRPPRKCLHELSRNIAKRPDNFTWIFT